MLPVVREGLGHAVLPRYTLSNFSDPESFAVHSIHSPSIESELTLVWSARRPLTQTHRQALQVMRNVVAEALRAYR